MQQRLVSRAGRGTGARRARIRSGQAAFTPRTLDTGNQRADLSFIIMDPLDEARPWPGIVPSDTICDFESQSKLSFAELQKRLKDYKETTAQSDNPKKWEASSYVLEAPQEAREALYSCGRAAITGVCVHGHAYAAVINCRRPYCPVCGQSGSASHMHRYSRLIPRAQKMGDMRYIVVEWPKSARETLHTREKLNESRRSLVRWFKRNGVERGIMALHTHGDPKCPHGCSVHHKLDKPYTDDGEHYICPICAKTFTIFDSVADFNPHWNILVDGGYMQTRELEELKSGLRNLLGNPDLIVNMSYIPSDDVARKLHRLKYISRPTFRNYRWNPELVAELKGFRYVSSWGNPSKWSNEDVWKVEGDGETRKILALAGNTCPVCAEKITWDNQPILIAKIEADFDFAEVVPGYFALSKRRNGKT